MLELKLSVQQNQFPSKTLSKSISYKINTKFIDEIKSVSNPMPLEKRPFFFSSSYYIAVVFVLGDLISDTLHISYFS